MSAALTPVPRGEAAGFRLHRFELCNWGTFHDGIWTIPLNGENGLLTGEIGSGKSTVVDAITTLLVPSGRAAYNRAAGADARERSLRSYVEGHYKSERFDDAMARPVALRGLGSYSVILGCFRNAATDATVTLAQVFWMKPNEAQPDRFYVVAERDLSIGEHFTGFGDDMANLRRRLKDLGAAVQPDFRKYRAQFVRLLGIRSTQALNLFHQTVSMKSVGNLTSFVRDHMLEPFDAGERIAGLIAHFDDLTRAYESIKVARRQIERLAPIVRGCDDHAALTAESASLAACQDAIYAYFARIKSGILERENKRLFSEALEIGDRLKEIEGRHGTVSERLRQLERDIWDSGGNRVATLERRIAEKRSEAARLRARYGDYAVKAEALGLQRVDGREDFLRNMKALASMKVALGEERRANAEALHAARVEKGEKARDLAALSGEIESIRASRSNLPARQVAIRAALAENLGVPEAALPFAGELLRVSPEERDWEGAAERILHGLALSLLAPDDRYRDVSEWVERNHLNGRLVYYRVRSLEGARRTPEALHPHSLVNKIEIKPDTPFFAWLYAGLVSHFDYVCCDDMASFRRESRAVTRAGQVKSSAERHEKDDRSKIDDRSRYVLGWDNREKLKLLEGQARVLSAATQALSARVAALTAEDDRFDERSGCIAALATFADYGEVDWRKPTLELDELQKERDAFVAASRKLEALTAQAEETRAELAESERLRDGAIGAREANRLRRQSTDEGLAKLAALLTEAELERHEASFEPIGFHCRKILGPAAVTLENGDALQRDCQKLLGKLRDEKEQEARRLSSRTTNLMQLFGRDFPLETQEFDATMESAGEYREMLLRLERDDLPRFEARFKELLNRNTIDEIASLQARLWREWDDIKERIATINRSLALIDYNEGRYIALTVGETLNQEVRKFQMDLRACTEDAFGGPGGDDAYSEKKFHSVCEIVERFKGRAEHAEADRRWTALVTDVRNWFVFSASERWKETGEEYEHYTDSGGKSGGQKEKLAYTVLAAGLAYQFGLDATSARSKTFRFVMIDEAFGRGSNESARFALSLFRALGLQLLVITPMQKHRVIEPYVSSVAFVHIAGGRASSLRHMSIEEFIALQDGAGNVDRP